MWSSSSSSFAPRVTHGVQLLPHPYAVRTPHSRSTSSLPKPPPTRPRQSLQGLPMTIHSSRMGCRYVLYSRSVRFAWAPSSARKVKMRKQAACTFARSCVRFRTQLRAFLHAARVVGTVLASRNHAAYAPVRTLRACVRTVITFPYAAACMRTQRADRRRGPPGRNQPTRMGGMNDPELMRTPSARQVDSSTRSTWSTAAE